MDQRDPILDPRRDDLRQPPEVRPGVIPILLGVAFVILLGFIFFGPARNTERTVTGQATEMPNTPPARSIPAPTPAPAPTPGPTNPH